MLRNRHLLPGKASELELAIESKKDDPEYLFESYDNDVAVLKKVKSDIVKYKIGTPEGLLSFESLVSGNEDKVCALKAQVLSGGMELAGYELCIRVLDRIDSKNNTRNSVAVSEFEEIRKHGRISSGKSRASTLNSDSQ